MDYWLRKHRIRHKNEKRLWHTSTNQHFPAYKCNIYRSASAQEMSSVCFKNMSLNIIKYKYSPETENKQRGSLLQASSGFGAGKKNAKRSTVHVYNKNPISQILHKPYLTTYYYAVKACAKWTLTNQSAWEEQRKSVHATGWRLWVLCGWRDVFSLPRLSHWLYM